VQVSGVIKGGSSPPRTLIFMASELHVCFAVSLRIRLWEHPGNTSGPFQDRDDLAQQPGDSNTLTDNCSPRLKKPVEMYLGGR
jgi:hypothetical protein